MAINLKYDSYIDERLKHDLNCLNERYKQLEEENYRLSFKLRDLIFYCKKNKIN